MMLLILLQVVSAQSAWLLLIHVYLNIFVKIFANILMLFFQGGLWQRIQS